MRPVSSRLCPDGRYQRELPAAFFLLIAGILHVPKNNKNPQEALATWTDMIVGLVVVMPAVYSLARMLTS